MYFCTEVHIHIESGCVCDGTPVRGRRTSRSSLGTSIAARLAAVAERHRAELTRHHAAFSALGGPSRWQQQ